MEEIDDQLTDFVWSYRYFHKFGESLEQDEKNDAEKSAELARDTFRAMFRGRMANESFLVDWKEEDVVETLVSWVNDAAPLTMSKRQVTSNLNDCSELLMRLTSEHKSVDDDEPAVWPYIKKIRYDLRLFNGLAVHTNNPRIYLKSHILSKGLVLVDLPGMFAGYCALKSTTLDRQF